ncbi:hypothetical protein GTW30_07955 [Streptomyces sp. SID7810]|nr:hypothetical protein [Streptomyces sp. SID7810]CUW26862.1 Transcriptional regulatory protein UhpA [Streptomyces reticuli]
MGDSYIVGLVHAHPLIRWAMDRILSSDPAITVIPDLDDRGLPQLDAVVTDSPLPAHIGRRVPDAKVLLVGPDDRPSPQELIASVRAVLGTPAAEGGDRQVSLTVRERQVLRHLAAGLTQRQVARRLQISPHTVDTYVRRIRKKTGPGNKAYLTQATLVRV